MKDLLVSLPSYNRSEEVIVEGRSVNKDFGPNKLERTIKMIFNTCHSKDNFDLQIIINEEQKEIYEYLKQKYPNLIWEYIEKGIAWENIIKAQNTQMQKGYYFFVFFSDDMYGLKPEWDKHILDKKHYFKDDLFVLYTKCIWSGRCPGIFERAYKDECIMTKHESFPIWTYKWGELTYHLFDQFKLEIIRTKKEGPLKAYNILFENAKQLKKICY